jgi:hypothetical protein
MNNRTVLVIALGITLILGGIFLYSNKLSERYSIEQARNMARQLREMRENDRRGMQNIIEFKSKIRDVSCTFKECVIPTENNEIFGVAEVSGYYTLAVRERRKDANEKCDAFTITSYPNMLTRYFDNLADNYEEPATSRNQNGKLVINIDISNLGNTERETLLHSNQDHAVNLILLKRNSHGGIESNVAQCFSFVNILKVDTEKTRGVSFCGKSYKTNGALIDGVDVVQRIAGIASQHPNDGVCSNISENQTNDFLEVTLDRRLNDVDYKEGDYYLNIQSTFKISGGKIYRVDGLDGTAFYYGNLK